MGFRTRIRAAFFASCLSIMGFSGQALADGAFLVVDILPLKSGKTVADAQAYFDGVESILARYGMTRVDQELRVTRVARGSLRANVINLWESNDPDAAFKGVFSDREYKEEYVPQRDAIFDMSKATVVVTQRISE